MFDFKDKVVLITGASYGLGEQFAYAFADAGADRILTARSTDLLDQVGDRCREKGARVTAVPGDVSVEADVRKVIARGIEEREPVGTDTPFVVVAWFSLFLVIVMLPGVVPRTV